VQQGPECVAWLAHSLAFLVEAGVNEPAVVIVEIEVE
jgi:hypothetical protein